MLTFRAGDPDRPRGHALLYFRDGDDPDQVWATYLVVAPIPMDLGKYIPAAFAAQLGGQLAAVGPAAYPLPLVPEKIEGGLAYLDRLAELRGDDLLDGGVLRLADPLYALQPVTEVGSQYADLCAKFVASAPEPSVHSATAAEPLGAGGVDVDELLLQVMPDREKVSRLARLTGTLRYATDGADTRLIEETVGEMQRIARHLGDKYRAAELIDAARSTSPHSADLAQLYLERCYRLAEEDYAALADLDARIDQLRSSSS